MPSISPVSFITARLLWYKPFPLFSNIGTITTTFFFAAIFEIDSGDSNVGTYIMVAVAAAGTNSVQFPNLKDLRLRLVPRWKVADLNDTDFFLYERFYRNFKQGNFRNSKKGWGIFA